MAKCALNSGATEAEKTWINGKDDIYETGTRCENIVLTGNNLLADVSWFSNPKVTTFSNDSAGPNFQQLTLEMAAFEKKETDWWGGWTAHAKVLHDGSSHSSGFDEAALLEARLPSTMQIPAPTEEEIKNATSMRYIFTLANNLHTTYGSGATKKEGDAAQIAATSERMQEAYSVGTQTKTEKPAYDNNTIGGEAQRLRALMWTVEKSAGEGTAPKEWNPTDIGTTVSINTSYGKWTGIARAYDDVKADWLKAAGQYASLLEDLDKWVNLLRQYNESHKEIVTDNAEATAEELKALQMKKNACKLVTENKGTTVMPVITWTSVFTGGLTGEVTAKDLCASGQLSQIDIAKMKELAKIQERAKTVETAGLDTLIAASQEPTRRTFKEQCLLLSHLEQFVRYRWRMDDEERRVKRLPYRATRVPAIVAVATATDVPERSELKYVSLTANATLLADREAWGFMNQLVQDPSYAALFNIENKYLSQLQPMIKLYKVSTVSDAKEEEIEVNFDNAFNSKLDSVLGNTKKRGFGVGIQSFNFSYEGSDPFAVKKSIKAKLSIFAASFDDLLVERGGYRYADLALKTGRGYKDRLSADNQTKIPALDDLNFRLKAVVGWSAPVGGEIIGATDSQSRSIKDAINNSFVTLNLTPTIHEFDINEQGQVVFHINYWLTLTNILMGKILIFSPTQKYKREKS